jgi:hypothetical protein
MPAFAFAAPILPGKEQLDAESIERLGSGTAADEYAAARRAAGVTREAIWHQKLPDGTTLAIVLLEADDPQAAFAHIATSDAEFDRSFRAMVEEVHGFDLATAPPPEVRPIADTSF